jgi:hypothetical protein
MLVSAPEPFSSSSRSNLSQRVPGGNAPRSGSVDAHEHLAGVEVLRHLDAAERRHLPHPLAAGLGGRTRAHLPVSPPVAKVVVIDMRTADVARS